MRPRARSPAPSAAPGRRRPQRRSASDSSPSAPLTGRPSHRRERIRPPGTVALVSVNATTSVAHRSTSKLALTAGDYAFKATYAGDGTNIGRRATVSRSACRRAISPSRTFIHLDGEHETNYDRNATGNETASVALNSTVHDVAVVSGAVTDIAPTGAITFTRWNNGTCTGDGTALAANGPDESGTGTKSANVGPLAPGAYSFKATIAADANIQHGDEPVRTVGGRSGSVGDRHAAGCFADLLGGPD